MNIIIKNLPRTVPIEDIENMCSRFGRVLDASITKEITNSRAYIKMSSDEEAKNAAEGINGTFFNGFILKVDLQKPLNLKGLSRKRGKKRYL